ncbi:hypothetical protein DL771_002413 [Monosporascus sp. 5C6A]|nr:hypothetical protein DL771_002413 [Monosporascus sp. 5C6A]
MWFSEKRDVPPVPPSLNVNPWKKHGDPNVPSRRSHDEITPYLGLRARYSQIWFNRWTVLLALVLIHFLLTADSLRSNLDDSKEKALSACTKVEDMGSTMASMPHYLSRGVNSLAASGITNSVQALVAMLDLIITAVNQLILFFIHMMTDTYVCLITLAVHTALNVSAIAVEKTTEALNSAIDGFADTLMKATDGIQSVVDAGWRIAEKVSNIGDDTEEGAGNVEEGLTDGAGDVKDEVTNPFSLRDFIPSIESLDSQALTLLSARDLPPDAMVALLPRDILPDKPDIRAPLNDFLQKIKDIDIDTSGFVDGIDKLNDKIPTFDEVREMTNDAVSIPFNMARDALNKAYGNWSFDQNVFPVAQKEALSFCSENSSINDFFLTLFEIARKAKITAIVVIIILAILACIPMAYMERFRWQRQVEQAEVFSQHQYDSMDVAYMYSRPRAARAGLSISNTFKGWRLSKKKQILARWCVAYATTLPALFILSLALAGLFSCLCQIFLLKAIERKVPELASQVGDFAQEVVETLGNVSGKWSDDANGVIVTMNNDINEDVFGVVIKATTAVNDTINTFTRTMDQGLQAALGETVFKEAAAGVIRCVIGLKIETVQKGLTWVHDHAHIDFPLFPKDVYSMGASDSVSGEGDTNSFLASPKSVTTDEITDAVLRVTRWLRHKIIQDALISFAFFLVYLLIVLIGVVWALVRSMTPDDDNTHLRETPLTSLSEAPRSPRTPRRSKSLGPIGSPRLQTGGGDPFSDHYKADYCARDGSLDRGSVTMGRGTIQYPAHARKSSHGYVGEVRS